MKITECLNEVKLTNEFYQYAVKQRRIEMLAAEVMKKFDLELNRQLETRWLPFECNGIAAYYVRDLELVVEDVLKASSYTIDRRNYPTAFLGRSTLKFSWDQVTALFPHSSDGCPMIGSDSRVRGVDYINYADGCYRICSTSCSGTCSSHCGNGSLNIASFPLSRADFLKKLSDCEYLLTGENCDPINQVFALLNQHTVALDSLVLYEDVCEKAAEILGITVKMEDAEKSALKEYHFSEFQMECFIVDILSADEQRADLEPDDTKCLEDVNLGHWELWEDETEQKKSLTVKLDRELVARNPLADIRSDGIVGIDFGTKSTIVSCQDGSDNISLLRIGMGQLSKAAEKKHYENPTVMEFIDLESFLSDYHAETGRPHTRLEDLTVSHKAANSLQNSENSGDYYSFFHDIKQWCGDSSRYQQIKIIDQSGGVRILPPYLEIPEGDFDPVEIYAYYLGLFINNMRNGIYLNYILSFPVAYSKAVREKLLKSFEAGLKKSLPAVVQHDEDAMQTFQVKQGVSEPAAYAITALQNYGFTPEGDEKIYYGIFDFGGGTTDFDFGIWRSADPTLREERRYDYVINHFGSGGDKYLGGENLLEMLAFEIFKANKEKLLKKQNEKGNFAGISFFKPANCSPFPGSEALISSSQEARRNIKQLMEVLRPFWEGLQLVSDDDLETEADQDTTQIKQTSSEENISVDSAASSVVITSSYSGNSYLLTTTPSIVNDGFLKVSLFDKEGTMLPAFQLDIVNPENGIHVDLLALLEKRIETGVRNFFEALRPLFNDRTTQTQEAEQIQIFLAGNSSKSPILRKCFEQYIAKQTAEISHSQKADDEYFVLYPPLGTSEALEIQKLHGVELDYDEIIAPTGKTGVAYGLIEGRTGGAIKVISEQSAETEVKFRFYLGYARKGKFIVLKDRNQKYHEWFSFTDAGSDAFELYYSSLPEVTSNKVDSKLISKKHLRISEVNADADVFIRIVSPTEIEYVVAYGNEEVNKGEYLCDPVSVDLS